MSDAIRVGIVGCGRVSWERHLLPLRRLPGFKVVAVCDRIAERSERVGELYGADRRLTDYRRLIELPDVDAVAVLTETGSHAEVGVAVLDAGKHLFLEKPLALTLHDAEALLAAERRSGRIAQVCFNLRWHRLITQAKAAIDAGILGQIKAIRSVYTHDRTGSNAPVWHRKLSSGGGVTFNEGVHHYDLWRYLLGCDFEQVHAVGRSSDVYEDETCVSIAKLSGGILGTSVMSFLSGPNSELEVFGESGRLLISLYRFDGLQFYSSRTYPGALADRLKRGVRAMLSLPALLTDARHGGGFQASFAGCWRSFGDAIRYGKSPLCTLDDGRKALEVALASVESEAKGCPVRVGEYTGVPGA